MRETVNLSNDEVSITIAMKRKLDGVGPVDNRPSTYQLNHIVTPPGGAAQALSPPQGLTWRGNTGESSAAAA